MSRSFTILLMLFCHIVDDYFLQGILASMKQKKWWTKQYQSSDAEQGESADERGLPALYSHDYIAALVMHSISWSFMVMLPIAFCFDFSPPAAFFFVFCANVIIHAVVDDLKANRQKINLIVDQLIHIAQIGCTAWVMLWLVK